MMNNLGRPVNKQMIDMEKQMKLGFRLVVGWFVFVAISVVTALSLLGYVVWRLLVANGLV